MDPLEPPLSAPQLLETVGAPPTPGLWANVVCQSPGAIWSLGGLTQAPTVYLSTVSRLHVNDDGSLGDDAWHDVAPMPYAQSAGMAVAVGGKLYVAGGVVLDAHGTSATAQCAVYDIAADLWTPLTPMPTAMALASMFADLEGNIHVVGGAQAGVHMVLDVAAGTWSVQSVADFVRINQYHRTCRVGDVIYILQAGGSFAYDLKTASWGQVPDVPGAALGGYTAAITAGRFVIASFQGSRGDLHSVYDTATGTWTPAPFIPPYTCQAASAAFSAGLLTRGYFIEWDGTARLVTFRIKASIPTMQEALVADTLAYFPLDGTLTDFTDPALVAGTGEGPPVFTPRWDGRDAQHLADDSDYLSLPAFGAHGLQQWPGFTVATWFRAPLGWEPQTAVDLLNDPQTMRLTVSTVVSGSAEISVNRYDGANAFFRWPGTGEIVAGRWYHVACAVDLGAGTVTPYVDGVVAGSFTQPVTGPLTDPFLQAAVLPFGASIDLASLCVFSRPVTADEALFLACDGYHPEGTFSSTVEYLSYNPAGLPVYCTDAPALNPSGSAQGLSVTAWVCAEEIDLASGAAGTILSRQGSFDIGIDAQGRPCANVWQGGMPTTLVASTPLGATQWSFVGLSLGAQQIALVVDGAVVATAPGAGYANVPSAELAVGQGWPTPIYGVGIYDTAFSAADFLPRMAETVDPQHDPQLLVYYDFAVNPAVARSPSGALAAPPKLPDGGAYEQFARGVALGLDARVSGGQAPDTILSASAALPVITLSGWVRQLHVGGYQTLAGRMAADGGYVLAVRDGVPEASIVDANGVGTVARSPIALPTGQFSQVGARFVLSPANPSAYAVQLVLNGREVAFTDAPVASPSPTIGDAATAFLIGAQDAPANAAGQSFSGLVQRMTAYDAIVEPYDLYYGTPAATPFADWAFDMEMPVDAAGSHPADLVNAATVQPYRSPDRVATPTLTAAQRQRRQAAWTPEPPRVEVPPEHLDVLRTDPSLRRRLTYHERDGITYVVAHGFGVDETQAECVFASQDIDPTVLKWIGLVVVIAGAFGLALYRVNIDAKAAFGVVKTGWDTASAVRETTYALATASTGEIPGLVYSLFAALYRAGLLGSLLRCFSISYFSVLRIAASFAPYVGAALMLAALAIAAKEIWQKIHDDPVASDVRPPNVTATPTSASLTLNGDPLDIHVVLDGPPPTGGATVTAAVQAPLSVVQGQTLTFTQANFAVPQTTTVQAKATIDDGPDTQPVAVAFDTTDAVPTSPCELELLVAKLVSDPTEVDLQLDSDGQNYSGSFAVSVTAPIASNSPLEVSFFVDDTPVQNTDFVFDPVTVTLDNSVQLSTRSARVRVKLASAKRKKTDSQLSMRAVSLRPGTAGNGRRYDTRLRTRAAEEISVTMVDAGRGNCFIITNTSNATAIPQTRCAVIDGGVPGTEERILPYLPATAPIDVYCSHYDNDHIGGLLALVPQIFGRIGQVIFNPPPPHAAEALKARLVAGDLVHPHIIQSVRQGDELAQISTGKLRRLNGSMPPPQQGGEQAGIAMPTLSVRWAGPGADVWARLVADLARHPAHPSPEAVNRASLIFSLNSRVSTFGFLQTGDGYDTLLKPDVRGPLVLPQPVIDFLQVPHHGSANNSGPLFYAAFPARNYLISTDYTSYGHPDVQTMASIVAGRSVTPGPFNIFVNTPDLPADYAFPPGVYSAYVRAPGRTGITFTWSQNGFVPNAGDVMQRR